MMRLILPGIQRGRERSEYACAKCFPAALDKYPAVKRVEKQAPRVGEMCPQCGEPAS